MSEYATIIAHTHVIPFGGQYVTYKWVGKKHLPVKIDNEYALKVSYGKNDLPWDLLLVKQCPEWNGGIFICKDALLPFGWAIVAKVKLLNTWKWFSYRVIVTMNIWGLAYTREGTIPSWHDIGKKAGL